MMKKRDWKSTKGFTLVEFIVILFVLTTISGIMVGVIYSVLRGSSRSHTTANVSSSGNYALSVISHLLISGERVVSVDGTPIEDCTTTQTGTEIEVLQGDGGVSTLSCEDETIASDGASLIDDFELQVVEDSCSFVCKQESFFDPPLVEVEFSIQPRVYEFPTDEVIEEFRTSAVLRNYSY